MNITHAEHEDIQGDRLEAIFNRQKELMNKYHDIELRSGLLQTEDCPVNLNDKRGQARIKDFAWRLTEEVGEALDAINDPEHYNEELIDGLHFLTELTILSGFDLISYLKTEIDSNDVDSNDCLTQLYVAPHKAKNEELGEYVLEVIKELGMMCNCLKNKPWKQTNMITDINAFNDRLINVWYNYIALLSLQMSSDDIADTYLKKSQVNKFRQRSNY